jgi:enamine deaminase RidA (YjgF/YER057c/UK114 family)
VDETFLQRMMLVFMDLASGYLLMEEVAVDRRFDTWYSGVNDRLKTLGTEVLYLVSDRAKALIKLAHTGLGCLSIPDMFHLSHDLAKGYALAIFGRLRQAKQALEQARQRLESLQVSQTDRDQFQKAQSSVEACAPSVQHWQEVRSVWKQHLSNLSRILHPWRLVDSRRQTSQAVEEQLRAALQAIETLLEANGLPRKKDTLAKVQTQLAGVSALVDFWWQTVRQDLEQIAMTPRWTTWAEELLLPLLSGRNNSHARAVQATRLRLLSCSRWFKRPLSGIPAPGS